VEFAADDIVVSVDDAAACARRRKSCMVMLPMIELGSG
jgi:hypothetical protein